MFGEVIYHPYIFEIVLNSGLHTQRSSINKQTNTFFRVDDDCLPSFPLPHPPGSFQRLVLKMGSGFTSGMTAMAHLVQMHTRWRGKSGRLRQGQRAHQNYKEGKIMFSIFQHLCSRSLAPFRWPLLYQGKAFTICTRILADVRNTPHPNLSLSAMCQNSPVLYFKHPLTLLSPR